MVFKDPNKLINFRVPNDLRIAFDEVCYQQDLTRTQSLTRLMKRFIQEGSLEIQRTRSAIEFQLNSFENRRNFQHPDSQPFLDHTEFKSEENWILVERDI